MKLLFFPTHFLFQKILLKKRKFLSNRSCQAIARCRLWHTTVIPRDLVTRISGKTLPQTECLVSSDARHCLLIGRHDHH